MVKQYSGCEAVQKVRRFVEFLQVRRDDSWYVEQADQSI